MTLEAGTQRYSQHKYLTFYFRRWEICTKAIAGLSDGYDYFFMEGKQTCKLYTWILNQAQIKTFKISITFTGKIKSVFIHNN